MSLPSSAARNVNWLLDDFVGRTPGVMDAIAVSADGILMASSQGLDRPSAEQFAAITCGLTSLTNGAARVFRLDGVEQIIVEMGRGFLFVTSIGLGSSLGVLASADAEIGLVAYEMTLLVDRFGDVLTPELISQLKNLLSV